MILALPKGENADGLSTVLTHQIDGMPELVRKSLTREPGWDGMPRWPWLPAWTSASPTPGVPSGRTAQGTARPNAPAAGPRG
ncbi:hypothetical protein [Streptomyces cathayae]|nr:hypothetical protein [Streptomyces sp. HUAS 5]WGD38731.1 hypothetical protein PYS65_00245 [Streptomyces sp. HUAS 5]WGD45237.1 hypothetical protein PYS65_34750 [Streptomyces sp. HUAS 5]